MTTAKKTAKRKPVAKRTPRAKALFDTRSFHDVAIDRARFGDEKITTPRRAEATPPPAHMHPIPAAMDQLRAQIGRMEDAMAMIRDRLVHQLKPATLAEPSSGENKGSINSGMVLEINSITDQVGGIIAMGDDILNRLEV